MPLQIPRVSGSLVPYLNVVVKRLKSYSRFQLIPDPSRLFVPEVARIARDLGRRTLDIWQAIEYLDTLLATLPITEAQLLRRFTAEIRAGLTEYLTATDRLQRNALMIAEQNMDSDELLLIVGAIRHLDNDHVYRILTQITHTGYRVVFVSGIIQRLLLEKMADLAPDQLYNILSYSHVNELGERHVLLNVVSYSEAAPLIKKVTPSLNSGQLFNFLYCSNSHGVTLLDRATPEVAVAILEAMKNLSFDRAFEILIKVDHLVPIRNEDISVLQALFTLMQDWESDLVYQVLKKILSINELPDKIKTHPGAAIANIYTQLTPVAHQSVVSSSSLISNPFAFFSSDEITEALEQFKRVTGMVEWMINGTKLSITVSSSAFGRVYPVLQAYYECLEIQTLSDKTGDITISCTVLDKQKLLTALKAKTSSPEFEMAPFDESERSLSAS